MEVYAPHPPPPTHARRMEEKIGVYYILKILLKFVSDCEKTEYGPALWGDAEASIIFWAYT